MLSIIDRIYCSIRRNEIRKLRKRVNSIRVEAFYETITKSCWKFGIQHHILVKNNEVLEIKLTRGKREVIVKFHKDIMVFIEDYERFLCTLERYEVKRGIYITTGVFDNKIIHNHKMEIFVGRRILLEDVISFGRKQMGWWGKAKDILTAKRFKLYRYLP